MTGASLHRCRSARVAAAFASTALIVAVAPRARAYDPATTHAGLTERAVLASKLNRVLTVGLGLPLGLFEPIVLDARELPQGEARSLEERLRALDPAQGYRPGDDGSATALAWVVAGAVVAGTPGDRARNTFFDPARNRGLQQGGGPAEVGQAVRTLLDAGGGPRGLATGTSFDLTGMPATDWLFAPENDVGLAVFHRELERSASAATPAARATALAHALLALGGTLSVLEDAGEPAHVRNDFREAYLGEASASPFDRGSEYEHFVAETYGRAGVPPPGPSVDRPSVRAYITAPDAQGLADRTQRRFFSPGSLPSDAVVERDTSARDVLVQARDSLPYGLPRLPRLELREMGRLRYAESADAAEALDGRRRRLLAYERVPGRVRFFLNRGVYEDSARVLLPEVGAYAAGLVDHLLRAELGLTVDGDSATVTVTGVRGALRNARWRLFAEDGQGRRGEIAARQDQSPAAGPVAGRIPAGTRRVAATLQAEDDAGPLVVVVERSIR